MDLRILATLDLKAYPVVTFKVCSRHEPVGHPGERLHVPAESVLTFRLNSPLRVNESADRVPR
jgi:hypothetical protein